MKNLLTICLILLGVTVQAQTRVYQSIEKTLMQQSLNALEQRAGEEDIIRELEIRDKAIEKNKSGTIRMINLYYLKSRTNKYFHKGLGDYIVTIQNVKGITPNVLRHPTIKDSVLQTSYFYVMQDALPQYEFYQPTVAQIKKLKGQEYEFARNGGLSLRKLTKARLKTLGYK